METLQLTDRIIDFSQQVVVHHGERVPLTDTEARLLRYLAAQPNQDISRESLLVDVWGMAPTSLSRCVDTAVRRLRRKIEARPDAPSHLLTAHGVGYRLALTVPAPVKSDRKVDDSGFIGRVADLERLGTALSSARRWVAVVGTGGIGKTRLVEAWLARHGGRLEGEVCWISARTLDETALQKQISRRLDHKEQIALLVLDGMEDGPQGLEAAVSAQFDQRSRLRVLTTSRLRPHTPATILHLEGLQIAEAVALLRAQARAHGADLDDEDAAFELVGALDRNPLAIEFAARWVRLLGCAGVVARLDQRLHLLADERRSLRETIQWSIARLSPEATDALHQLAVFRGAFSIESAEAIVDVPGASPLLLLRMLQEASVLRPCPDGRLQLYALFRARLDEASIPEAAAARHARWVRKQADALRAQGATNLSRTLDGLEQARDDLLAAWRWSVRHPDQGELMGALAYALVTLLRHRGPATLRMAVLDETLRHHEALAPRRTCLLLQLRSNAHREAASLTAAADDLRRAIAIADDLADPIERGHCEASLAIVEHTAQRRDAARVLYERAIEKLTGADDSAVTRCLLNLSALHQEQGHDDLAEVYAREAMAVAVQRAAPRDGADARHHLGRLLSQRGQYAEASALLEACVAAAVSAGDQRRQVAALWSLGELRLGEARLLEAREAFFACAEAAAQRGAALQVSMARANAAVATLLHGEPASAVEALSGCVREIQRLSPSRSVFSLAWLARAQHAAGHPHLARHHLSQAHDLLSEVSPKDDHLLVAVMQHCLEGTPTPKELRDEAMKYLDPRIALLD